ncbi:C40 family peptidase [Streptomyces yaizuensis]|uniref:NlpC/P60 family protein n=1 Tax=Streptomyces yaizuensis TaxID=2989713 RepID=A0ABQ5PAY4_9ACTN|nr:NlpC/P60 family protein [Streptomyces sp. YSPA8]GLF99736.1 NlpC/P60 family protein [Streptomyces sp. YSPA8]
MIRRRCATAALTVVCALAVLAAPGTALAAPPAGPGASALLPQGAPRAPEPPGPPGPPGLPPETSPSSPSSLERVRLEIAELYDRAVSATDAYNRAEERTERQSAEMARLTEAIDRGRARIDRLQAQAGAAAREQYRGGGLPSSAQLLLADDPGMFLDGADRFRQSLKATGDLLTELDRAQSELETYTRDASAEWRRLEADRRAREKAKQEINARVEEARRLEGRLAKEERERLLALEREAAARAQAEWLRTTRLNDGTGGTGGSDGGDGGGGDRPSTSGGTGGTGPDGPDSGEGSGEQGTKAVAFAKAQLGKPYGWGDEGPDRFDCSGLTSQAWAAGGVTIPRTSQDQWRRLTRVGVEELRPGDLIVYNADASHVGIYIGDGRIVHSPRPGRTVTVAGAGSMKILGVVRPDA